MLEDRLKRRMQRWSQWQARLAATADAGDAADRPAVGHWSRAAGPRPPRGVLPAATKHAIATPMKTTELADGTETVNSLGPFWHMARPLDVIWPASRELITRVRTAPDTARSADRTGGEVDAFIQAFPKRTLFLDLETCGLAGSAIFLVGLIRETAGQLQLEQLWARSHAEEAGLMGALREIAEDCDVLITFNGKSFDWPQVCDRATLHTRAVDGAIKQLQHWDLLHHARRRYKKRFGDCKLQTLERHLCGRIRHGDLASGQIPAVYAEYVRTADARLVHPILHHNALDLVTLLELAVRLTGDDRDP